MNGQKTKILHFIDSGGLYGAERVLLNLSKSMLTSDEYEPVVGCIVSCSRERSDLYDAAVAMGVMAEKVVIRNSRLLLDLPRVARQFKHMGIRLIHSHGYKPSVFGYAIKQMAGIDVMATCHLWFRDSDQPLKTRVMVTLELLLYRSFRAVVGVSEPIKKVLVDAGVPFGAVQVIRNGVETGAAMAVDPAQVAQLRRELHLKEGDCCIVNTGRLTEQKAQRDIVAAAEILREETDMCRFLIVGEGELKEELEIQISRAKLSGTVELLGFRDDIQVLLQVADIYILPSLDEGMPVGLLEAAAAGLPVVVTPVGDVLKLVKDGESGLVVPAADPKALAAAITAQMGDSELRNRLGAAVQKEVKKSYSNQAMYDNYSELYARLIGF